MELKFLILVVCCSCLAKYVSNAQLTSEEEAELTESCCTHGETFGVGSSSREECSTMAAPDDVEEDQVEPCLVAARACCQKHYLQKDQCSDGMKYSPAQRCTVPKTDIGKACCDECSFGRWSGESQGKEACPEPADPQFMSPITALRKNAFRECCLKAAAQTTTTTTTTTPPPTTEKKIETTTKKRESCKEKNPCSQVCEDDDGVVKCQCNKGYRLQSDGKSCKDINECMEYDEDLCTEENTVCHNMPGSFKCVPLRTGRDTTHSCPPGFKKNALNQVCDDINECQLPRPPCPKYLCENTIGGYKCSGKPGKPSTEPKPEASTAPSKPKSNMCPQGFRDGPHDECVDIDECEEHLDDCQRLSQYCINSHGNFFCQDHVSRRCAPGFKVNALGVCEDINECENSQEACRRNEICVNLPGAYDCKSKISSLPKLAVEHCQEGTRMRGGSCEDIDECREGTHLCDMLTQNCFNKYAGFECSCKDGFELDSSSNACVDIDECAQSPCSGGLHCVNRPGTYSCSRQPLPLAGATPPTPAAAAAGTTHAPDEYEYYYSDEEEEGRDLKPTPKTTARPTPKPASSRQPESNPDPMPDPRPNEFISEEKPEENDQWSRSKPVPARPQTTSTTTTTTTPAPRQTYPRPPPLPPLPPRPSYPASPRPTQAPSTQTPYRPTQAPTTPATTTPRQTYPRPPPLPPLPPRPNQSPVYPESRPPRPNPSPGIPDTRPRPNPSPGIPDTRPRPNPSPGIPDTRPRPNPSPGIPDTRPRPNPSPGIPDTRPKPSPSPVYPDSRPARPYPSPSNPYPENGPVRPAYQPIPVNPTYPSREEMFPKPTRPSANIPSTENKPESSEPEFNYNVDNLHCLDGYKKNDNGECVDVDECSAGTHTCNGLEVCTNTAGRFTCACAAGYERDPTGWCVSIKFLRPESTTGATSTTERTTAAAVPTQPDWNYQPPISSRWNPNTPPLFCELGYQFDKSKGRCVDIDECATRKASCRSDEQCLNTDGGYQCRPDTSNFVAPTNPSLPSVRGNNVITVGSQYGQRGPKYRRPSHYRHPDETVVSVNCPWGYKLTGDKQCLDVDECALGASECGPQQTCENFYGGYQCQCPAGHQISGTRECEDINECAYGNSCSINAQCVNTVGSYRCACAAGFRTAPSNDKMCVDVDECYERPALCQQSCVNAWGGYRCTCNRGYQLAQDNSTCVDVDECAVVAARRGRICVGDCVNTPGSYRCSCPKGYRVGQDGKSCIDIDECETGEATCARGADSSTVCQNTRGGYHCHTIDCPPGYKLESKHICRKIQQYCQINDISCLQQPSSYSYHFITFVSNIFIMRGASVSLFSVHGPSSLADSVMNFELQMLRVEAPPHVRPADISCFDMKPSATHCAIALVCSLEGPQVAELELTTSVYQRGRFYGTNAARVIVIVSQYEY